MKFDKSLFTKDNYLKNARILTFIMIDILNRETDIIYGEIVQKMN